MILLQSNEQLMRGKKKHRQFNFGTRIAQPIERANLLNSILIHLLPQTHYWDINLEKVKTGFKKDTQYAYQWHCDLRSNNALLFPPIECPFACAMVCWSVDQNAAP